MPNVSTRYILLLVCMIWGVPYFTYAQPPDANTRYNELLNRIKRGDRRADFKAFRNAYIQTTQYNPYSKERDRLTQEMFKALYGDAFDKALELCDQILEMNFQDLDAHMAAWIIHERLGHTRQATFHDYVLGELIDLIMANDGDSFQTAIKVISTDEEYFIIRIVMRLNITDHAMVEYDGHYYDKIVVVDPETGESSTLYFNIDEMFAWSKTLVKVK